MSSPSFDVYLILLETGPSQKRYMLALMPEKGSQATFYFSDLDDIDCLISQARDALKIWPNQSLADNQKVLLKEHLATFTGLANKVLFIDKASQVLGQPHGRYVSQVLALLCGSGLIPNNLYGQWRFVLEPITSAAIKAMNESSISSTRPRQCVQVLSSRDSPACQSTVSSLGSSGAGVVRLSQSLPVGYPSVDRAPSDILLQILHGHEVPAAAAPAAASSDLLLPSISRPSRPRTALATDPTRSLPPSTGALLGGSLDPLARMLRSTSNPSPPSASPARSQQPSAIPQDASSEAPYPSPPTRRTRSRSNSPLPRPSPNRQARPNTHPHNSPPPRPSPGPARASASPRPSPGPARASASLSPAGHRRSNNRSSTPQPARNLGVTGSPLRNPSAVSPLPSQGT